MRGRPPTAPSEVTPRQIEVARLVAAGHTNEQIARELGISHDGAKYHVSEILGRLGLQRREEIAEWYAREHGGTWRRLRAAVGLPVAAWVGGGAVVAAAVIAFVAVSLMHNGSGDANLVPTPGSTMAATPPAVDTATQPAPLPIEQHGEYRAYGPDELRDAGFISTGAFVIVPGGAFPVVQSSYRATRTVLDVAGSGYIDYRFDHEWAPANQPSSGGGAFQLRSEVEGRELYLMVTAVWEPVGATHVIRAPGTVSFYTTDDGVSPQLTLELRDEEGRSYPAVVDHGGHLWIRPAPIPAGPAAWDTGELLDASEAERFGPLGDGIGNWQNDTDCVDGVCASLIHVVDGLHALFDGDVSCTGAEVPVQALELDRGDLVLRFEARRPGALRLPLCEDDLPGSVSTDDYLSRHASWWVTAFDADGTQLSVAVEGKMLHVGEIEPVVRNCPCRGRR
jgi:DNA-binding CsgD family transcriptional regulator